VAIFPLLLGFLLTDERRPMKSTRWDGLEGEDVSRSSSLSVAACMKTPESVTRRTEMRKVVVTEFITLDGTIEDPGGSEKSPFGGWAFKFDRGDDGNKFKLDETMASDALLLGRTTYEGFAEAWPGRTDDIGFADKFNSMPKYVVSSSLTSPEWNNSHVISGDLEKEVAALKEEGDGDLVVHGSAQLVRALLEKDLVDELRLMVFPYVAGGGKKLFAHGTPHSLKLVAAKQASEVAILTLKK
jgi:dihydrofolate reductase